jgi:hypothetical protein
MEVASGSEAASKSISPELLRGFPEIDNAGSSGRQDLSCSTFCCDSFSAVDSRRAANLDAKANRTIESRDTMATVKTSEAISISTSVKPF